MRYCLLIFFNPILYVPTVLNAADANGYTAQYECREDGPYCKVDIARLGQRDCDQIITTYTTPLNDWSAINQNKNTICIEAGDHTKRGTLKLTSSGTRDNYKVLRYYRSEDSDDDPWDQSSPNRANIYQLKISGNYWVVHRLTFPGINGTTPTPRIESNNNSRFHILDRLLVEGNRTQSNYYGYASIVKECAGDIWVQNSVFRNVGPWKPKWEAVGINFVCGNRKYAVNNEIYDWVAHPIMIGRNGSPKMEDIVIENNDLYVTPALYTDCNGNFNGTGPCDSTEALLSRKNHGTASNPIRIINNRLWGRRNWDGNMCCNGDGGQIMGGYDNNEYHEIRNNILMDAPVGINNMADYMSVVGNIFYNIKKHKPGKFSHVINDWTSSDGKSNYELYLNTVISAKGDSSFPTLSDSGVDAKCNVFIDSVGKMPSKTPASSVADNNAFYGSSVFTYNGSDSNIEISVSTRSNSTRYSKGAVVRWDSINNCSKTRDTACFLYMAINSGNTNNSRPEPCTTLGCSFDDGDIKWKAIRGPYSFYRKLRTDPERVVIPYALPYADSGDLASGAPEALACPSNYASRRGIGINDVN